MGGDNGEFVAIARVGGVAHPPGYPLYSLLLQALHWLPGSPAHSAALATALLGGAQILLLVMALQAWGASVLAASVTAAMVAASSLALLLNSYAEVFCLNALIAAGLLLVCSPDPPCHGQRRLLALAVLWACGLANHHSIVLLTPLLLLGIVSACRESDARWRSLGLGAVLFSLLFCGFYGSLLLASRVATSAAFVWGDGGSLRWLIDHFLRRHYGTFRLASAENPYDYGAQLHFFWASLVRSWWIVLAVIPVGVRAGWRQSWTQDTGLRRFFWPALCASWLLSGPVFFLGFNFNLATPFGREVVQRFHLLPVLLLAPAVAVGLDACAVSLRGLMQRQRLKGASAAPWLVAPLNGAMRACVGLMAVLYGFAIALMLAWPQLLPLRSGVLDRTLRNSLNGLPPNAVLLIVGDSQSFGYLALQKAEGLRPDVTVVWRLLLAKPWYRRQLPAPLVAARPLAVLERQQQWLIDRALSQGRPVFVDPQPGIPSRNTWYGRYRSVPYGAYRQLLAPGEPAPTAAQIFATNRRLFSRYDLRGLDAELDSSGQAALGRYLMTWAIIERLLRQQGQLSLASQAAAFRNQLFFARP